MTGVLRPDSGSAEIMGYDVRENSIAAREQIGVVPELANAYEELSGWRNLMIAAGLYSVPRERARRASSPPRHLPKEGRPSQGLLQGNATENHTHHGIDP
jgi:hypothetical protein